MHHVTTKVVAHCDQTAVCLGSSELYISANCGFTALFTGLFQSHHSHRVVFGSSRQQFSVKKL